MKIVFVRTVLALTDFEKTAAYLPALVDAKEIDLSDLVEQTELALPLRQ